MTKKFDDDDDDDDEEERRKRKLKIANRSKWRGNGRLCTGVKWRGTEDAIVIPIYIRLCQKPKRVETCNGPVCAGKQASEYSIF